MGFEDDNFNFHIYDLDKKKVIITPNAKFDEEKFPFLSQVKKDDHSDKQPTDDQPYSPLKFFDDESDDDSVKCDTAPLNSHDPTEKETDELTPEDAGPRPS